MRKQVPEIAFTTTSSKGQVVIPTKIRKELGIREGSLLAVSARNDMIVLKKVDSDLTAEDLKSLRLVEEAWKDIEEGRYGVKSKQAFFEELKNW